MRYLTSNTAELSLDLPPSTCQHEGVSRKASQPIDGLLLPEELAERLNVSEYTLRQWRWQGRGPSFVKVGRGVRYKESAVQEYLASSEYHLRDGGLDPCPACGAAPSHWRRERRQTPARQKQPA